MKSEEFVMQELEKERMLVQNPGQEIDSKNKIKFMISQEAPMLMTKACELLIKELAVRAWQHTERNRRRTLQKADLHAAVGESEVFDFLIDIVPRVATTRQPQASGAISMPSQLTTAIQANNGGNITNVGDGTQMPSQEQMQQQQMQFNLLLQQLQQQGTQPQMDGLEQQVNLAQQQQQQQEQMQQQEQQSITQPQWTDPQV